DQYVHAGPVPDRKGSADRSFAKRGVAENSVRAAPGKSARLPPVRTTGFAPGEFRIWQYRLGGRLQGKADAFCPAPLLKRSVGFAGVSDGWQDLAQHFQMTWEYDRAEKGNIALTAEIDLVACNGEFILALGFGGIWAEAGQQALSSLLSSY